MQCKRHTTTVVSRQATYAESPRPNTVYDKPLRAVAGSDACIRNAQKRCTDTHTQLSTTKHCGVHHYTTMHTFMLSGGSPSPVVAATNTANFCSSISHATQFTHSQLPPFTSNTRGLHTTYPHLIRQLCYLIIIHGHHNRRKSSSRSIQCQSFRYILQPHRHTDAPRQRPRTGAARCVCVLWQAPHLCCSSLTAIQQQQPMSLWRWWQHSCILNTIIHCHIISNNCSSSRSSTVRSHHNWFCVTCVSKQPSPYFKTHQTFKR